MSERSARDVARRRIAYRKQFPESLFVVRMREPFAQCIASILAFTCPQSHLDAEQEAA